MMKMLSHRLQKASARNEAELALIRAWYGDIFMLANCLSQQDLAHATLHVVQRQPRQALPAPVFADPAVKTPVFAAEQPPAKKRKNNMTASAEGEIVELRTIEGLVFTVPKYAAKLCLPNVNAKQAQQIFRANGSAGQKAFRRAFERICRTVGLLAKGPVGHTVAQCKKSRAVCSMPCPRCGGRHWTQACSKK